MTHMPIITRIGISGYFKVFLEDAQTGNIKRYLEFPNLITNAGLNQIGTGNLTLATCFNFLDVGSGSQTPAVTDIKLRASTGYRTSFADGTADITTTNSSPEYAQRQITRVFTESEANGDLTEFGIWTGTLASSVLMNRSLIKDSLGNPTVLTKTPSDRLRVQFQYRLAAPQTDNVVLFSGDGNLFPASTGTLRPQGVGLSNNWVALLDSMGNWTPSFRSYNASSLSSRTSVNDPVSSIVPTSITTAVYGKDNFYRDVTLEFGVNDGNTTHGLLTFNPWSTNVDGQHQVYQFLLTPAVTKIQDQKLRMTFRFLWGRS
jgi:hypothetical protein